MPFEDNLYPVHNNTQVTGASSVASNLYSQFGQNAGFLATFVTPSSSIASDLETSTYQFGPASGNAISETEKYPLSDFAASNMVGWEEKLPYLDSAIIKQFLVISAEDRFALTDFAASSIKSAIEYQDDYSTVLNVGSYQTQDYGVKLLVAEAHLNDAYSTSLSVTASGSFALTTVSTATGATNPFMPTVAVGGNLLFGNTATLPPSLLNTSLYVQYLSSGVISNLDLTNLFSFSFQLDYGGGSFSFVSNYNATPPDLGEEMTFFGLKGGIIERGEIRSNTQKGWIVQGTFGNLILHRQMILLLPGTQLATVGTTQALIIASKGTTAASMANAIASAAGVTLTWNAQDIAYANTLQESGSTGLTSMSQLAARVGAGLRWNGNASYVVAYPPRTFGTWICPDPHLITGAGLKYVKILDLESGIKANGVYYGGFQIIPALNNYDAGTTTMPINKQAAGPQAQQVGKVSKLLTKDDPPVVFDLPQNYDKVYIQILVSGAHGTGGANQVSIDNFVTIDPKEWKEFAIEGFANDYIFMDNVGGAYIPKCKVDFKLMPDNPSVQDNHFVLSIACTLKDLSGQFEANQQKTQNDAASLLAQQQDAYRWVKTYSGEINCLFYGVVPLPGMFGSATVDGLTVEGVIESVSINYPGIITIQVAQYAQIYYLNPLPNLSAINNPPFLQT